MISAEEAYAQTVRYVSIRVEDAIKIAGLYGSSETVVRISDDARVCQEILAELQKLGYQVEEQHNRQGEYKIQW